MLTCNARIVRGQVAWSAATRLQDAQFPKVLNIRTSFTSYDNILYTKPDYLSACPPAYLSACPPARLPVRLPARPPTCPPAHPPAHLPVCLPAHLPVCLPVCLPVYYYLPAWHWGETQRPHILNWKSLCQLLLSKGANRLSQLGCDPNGLSRTQVVEVANRQMLTVGVICMHCCYRVNWQIKNLSCKV